MPPPPERVMHLLSCPACRRRGTARRERELRGDVTTTLFTCSACAHVWKPRAHTLEQVERRRRARNRLAASKK